MAKLPTAVAETAQQATPSTGFQPVPAGIYRVKCIGCRLVVENKAKDGHNAEWDLVVEQDGVRAAKLWLRISHKAEAAGMMHGAFNAFGLTMDSDEDEFVGEFALADVSVEKQEQGKNAGKMVNQVAAMLPLAGAVAAGQTNGQQPTAATTAGTAGKTEDPWE
jgi:hypothetical protein